MFLGLVARQLHHKGIHRARVVPVTTEQNARAAGANDRVRLAEVGREVTVTRVFPVGAGVGHPAHLRVRRVAVS